VWVRSLHARIEAQDVFPQFRRYAFELLRRQFNQQLVVGSVRQLILAGRGQFSCIQIPVCDFEIIGLDAGERLAVPNDGRIEAVLEHFLRLMRWQLVPQPA